MDKFFANAAGQKPKGEGTSADKGSSSTSDRPLPKGVVLGKDGKP